MQKAAITDTAKITIRSHAKHVQIYNANCLPNINNKDPKQIGLPVNRSCKSWIMMSLFSTRTAPELLMDGFLRHWLQYKGSTRHFHFQKKKLSIIVFYG